MPSVDPVLRAQHRKAYYERVKLDPERYARRKQQNVASRRKAKLLNPVAFLLYSARERAKKYKLDFALKESDVTIPVLCPILKIPLQFAAGYAQPDSPSLDRIDPAKGYVPGNVVVMSHRANRIKGDATIEELLAVISFLKGKS